MCAGSGSIDFKDYSKLKTFNQTIKDAMTRELKEENSLNKTDFSAETKILGFFRWIKRGGKPEFVGITKISCDYTDLEPDRKEGFRIQTYSLSPETELKLQIE